MNFVNAPRVKLRSLLFTAFGGSAIDRQKLSPEQIELPAQDDELAKRLPEGRPVHAAEIGDGAEVRLPVPQQPDDLDVAMGLCHQPPAGSHPVDVAVHVELQQIGRINNPDDRSPWQQPAQSRRQQDRAHPRKPR